MKTAISIFYAKDVLQMLNIVQLHSIYGNGVMIVFAEATSSIF